MTTVAPKRVGRPRRDASSGDLSRVKTIHDQGPTDDPALEIKPPAPESFKIPRGKAEEAGKSPLQRTLEARKTPRAVKTDIEPVNPATALARTGLVNPWDQRPGEPGEDYNRFLSYLRMGRTRTVVGAYRVHSGNTGVKNCPPAWSATSIRWDWADRAALYDAAQQKIALQKQMDALEGMHEQRAAHATDFEKREYLAGLKMMQQGMDLMDDSSPQAKEAGARMVHRSSVMMRTALGMAGGRGVKAREFGDDGDGRGGGKLPNKPFSEMTTAELAAFKKLANAADAMERATARASRIIDVSADDLNLDDDPDDEDEDDGKDKGR